MRRASTSGANGVTAAENRWYARKVNGRRSVTRRVPTVFVPTVRRESFQRSSCPPRPGIAYQRRVVFCATAVAMAGELFQDFGRGGSRAIGFQTLAQMCLSETTGLLTERP